MKAKMAGVLRKRFSFPRSANRPLVDMPTSREKLGDDASLEKMKATLISKLDDDALDVAEVEDAVCRVEDMVDEIETGDLLQKVEDKSLTKIIRSPFSLSRQMKSKKLTEIQNMLQNLPVSSPKSRRTSSTNSDLDDTQIFGRNQDKEAIVELLLSKNVTPGEIGVIAIVGMGGIGKTTLAQLAYNDYEVGAHFDLHFWVCVSEGFDNFKVTKAILGQISHEVLSDEIEALDTLQASLKSSLTGKRFLLVLDDVWDQDRDQADWENFRSPLKSGAHGSKIIVTTRNATITSIIHADPYPLGLLPDDACWRLFKHRAFRSAEHLSNPQFSDFGRKIVQKCRGLPLAVKALADLLRSKSDVQTWEDVSKRPIVDPPNPGDGILPCLNLSYEHLPLYLKRCFAYCSIFPKGYEFAKEKLVLLWMGAGLLQRREDNESLEDVGGAYFDELVSRSFFVPSNDKLRFVMHDLIHDLAQYVSKESCFGLEDDNKTTISDKVRHFSFISGKHDLNNIFNSIVDAKSLRTFLPLTLLAENKVFDVTKGQLKDLFAKLQYLRVLCLSHYNLSGLPQSINRLMYLRYLDLSYTPIERLSGSITVLCNLQTLLLSNCSHLTELPAEFVRLLNLCHLDICDTPLKEMPPEMSRLQNLQTLTNFIIGKHGGSKIKELGDLSSLHGTLCISKLENVTRDASEANLRNKTHLDELVLQWSDHAAGSEQETRVLDQLQPHLNLEKLSIVKYSGTRFPSWLGDSSFSKMVFLRLGDCKYCSELPPLGRLPSLKDLIIRGLNGVEKVGFEFYGINPSTIRPFQSLQTLTFEDMLEWKEWTYPKVARGEFRCLKELRIRRCPKLKGDIPKILHQLENVEIHECPELVTPKEEQQFGRVEGVTLAIKSLKVSEISELMNLPPGLCSLKIEDCHAIESLPEELISGNTDLQHLHIIDCHSLKSFPGGHPPTTLKTLYIRSCRKLEFIPSPEIAPTIFIENLCIGSSCDSLESFSLASFPKLKSLSIWDCANLSSILVPEEGTAQNFLSLEALEIRDCPKMESFLTGGLPASNITSITLSNCKNLKELPEQLHLFISLQSLSINDCPELVSLPEGGLPPNFSLLCITSCERLTPQKNWGLHELQRLTSFDIDGGCKEVLSFPEENLLPCNLNFLRISKLTNLESLNYEGLRHLTSLETLQINCCNNLHSLPEEGLPSSLSSLLINECSLLRPRLKHKTGTDWSKIAYIPQSNVPRVWDKANAETLTKLRLS